MRIRLLLCRGMISGRKLAGGKLALSGTASNAGHDKPEMLPMWIALAACALAGDAAIFPVDVISRELLCIDDGDQNA